MFLYWLSNLNMGASPAAAPVALVVYVDPRAVQLNAVGSDGDPFGVDPRAAQLYAAGSDADPFGVDPRAAQLYAAGSDADPFGVDPRAAQLNQ